MEQEDDDGNTYEEKFEQDVEDNWSLTDSYHDDQLVDLMVHEDEDSNNEEGYSSSEKYASYFDCDADLEKVLTNGNVTFSPEEIEQFINCTGGDVEETSVHRFWGFFRRFLRRKKNSFYDAPEEVGYDTTPDSGLNENLQNLDPEQRAKLEEEWKADLAKTEDEIQTLRQVLAAHVKRAQELKRRLGITAWKEFRDDMEQGLKNVKDSNAYQKTNTALKSASEKTTSALGTLGASVSRKLGDVKNSTAFRSFEEKMGSAYSNVRTKMTGSRSNSFQDFDKYLEENEAKKSSTATPATTPTIPEDKPLS